MKKLFKNYNYSFDKNEIKLISNFCKQAISQMETDSRFAPDVKAFNSILDKINSGDEEVKFTKDERTRLVMQLKENVKHIEKTMQNVWFIKKWLYKSMLTQYRTILSTHFEG